jgi:guanine deaminase
VEANQVLVQQIHRYGQRALVGKVCMDCNSPAAYCEATADSAAATEAFIGHIQQVLKVLICVMLHFLLPRASLR